MALQLMKNNIPTTVTAKIIARSSNTNSFGLREHVLVFRNGYAFKACRSAHVPDADKYAANQDLTLDLPDFDFETNSIELAIQTELTHRGFELVRPTAKCPSNVLNEIFSK